MSGASSPAFEGQRPPFEPGNELAATHGGYSELRLQPLREAAADLLRRLVPSYDQADEPTIRVIAGALARIELANAWLAEEGLFRGEAGELQPVLRALSTWENTALRGLVALGCAPTVRKQLELGSRGAGAGAAGGETAAELHAQARLESDTPVERGS